ncbi:MAG: bifunctional 5,10-methylene-tetrahydrofolate dehydrogenase/5,10-methylene-tetrahydrofolate cyclohydrolase [SAR324 cluster bacterium]|nr:bifunctional 5,10-methylene-tetrahydrofolate dehydrogenase/5,10-methylene-tetrahydrofolate cyclohydrolase [SAR324 cluster bacterium]MCZ6533323.1 bifunctional 5,10-methylene-tetrahydrofolate dehydrogenase/5,10-methylene-tetrahydrofolate cyclohydrolase [SAR324 cluster bacterium]MCZ6558909.1 bifunctional 5,10-methylene-tetrahydrofolate dehydrogenase/5,10-methylene-tetrahydrofolate cyclohydrolase [SAR324 cluster bacterium]MCZ6628192.1 bifunctional 5,10-methylene-tetrahydrofolate dehydrogenase/5,1
MKILSGKELSELIQAELAGEAAALKKLGCTPTLAVIRVGEDEATGIYVRNKVRAAAKVGLHSEDIHLPASTSQSELEAKVECLNSDPAVHGLICQLPLPGHLNEKRLPERIDPLKDVDCFHPLNFGLMAMGTPRFLPCTPAGIIEILLRYEVPVAGQHVVVLGRSNIVGRPVAMMLGHKGIDATVSLCHSRSKDAAQLMRQADILVAAIGQPEWVKADMLKEGAVVIDVGVHQVPDPSRKRGYRICGDVDQADAASRAAAMTPVPGGVGPVTITMLLKNTIAAARMQMGGPQGGDTPA